MPEYLPPEWAHWLIYAWLAVSIVLPLWLLRAGFQKSQILLVVDDLDRCDPGQMVSIIECLKMLLEDPAVSDRAQVIMLVEEDALKNAVLGKYQALLATSRKDLPDEPGYTEERVWRESTEKLFAAHLRLPRLSKQEIAEVMDHFAGVDHHREKRDILAKRRKYLLAERTKILQPYNFSVYPRLSIRRPIPPPITSEVKRIDEELDSLRGPDSAEADRSPPSPARLFTDEEVLALNEIAPSFERSKSGVLCSPRSVRNFLFRFQLAKLLLLKEKVSISPKVLVASLAQAAGYPVTALCPTDESARDAIILRRIVEQVS